MKIQPIVEGHGDVAAVPVLLRRLIAQSGAFDLGVGRPILWKHHHLLRQDSLKKAVRLAKMQGDCAAILVLFEDEDDCPKTLGPKLSDWVRNEAGEVPCAVVLAHREYETWFLAAIESLRGRRGIRLDAEAPPDPEAIRGAKEAIGRQMQKGYTYMETTDQPALSDSLDFREAYSRSRSFRHLVTAFGKLLDGLGKKPQEWPPSNWAS